MCHGLRGLGRPGTANSFQTEPTYGVWQHTHIASWFSGPCFRGEYPFRVSEANIRFEMHTLIHNFKRDVDDSVFNAVNDTGHTQDSRAQRAAGRTAHATTLREVLKLSPWMQQDRNERGCISAWHMGSPHALNALSVLPSGCLISWSATHDGRVGDHTTRRPARQAEVAHLLARRRAR